MDSIPGPVHPDAEGQTNAQSTAAGLRRLLPAVNSSSSGEQTNAYSGLTRQTRHQVPAACLQCRKRKVKCSGNRPTCHRCSQTDIECEWDTEPDTSRIVQIRKRKEELERENEDLHELLQFLQTRPEEEAVEILKRLRASDDALQVLDFVRTADLLLQRRQTGLGASPRDPNPSSSEVDDMPASFLKLPARPWTALANDGVVSELITGFFLWDASFFLAFVDRKAFLDDMRDRMPSTAKYCSAVLVNAICALRCHTSRRAKAFGHVNGCDMRSLFFEEAKRLLDFESGRPSLTTAQALFIMHLSAAAAGMDRAARMYQLAAIDMLQETQIVENPMADGEDKRHDRVISRAMWGLYCFESIFAFSYLRPSLIPTPLIPRSFIDQVPQDSLDTFQDDHRGLLLLNTTCDLSIISNKAMEYNAGLKTGGLDVEQDVRRRIDLFAELRTWRDTIPHEFEEAEVFSPSAYYLRLETILATLISWLFWSDANRTGRAYEDQVILAIFRPLQHDLQLPDDGLVSDLLLAYCERSIAGIEEHERALSLRECSSMILTPLFNVSITLARLLGQQKTHELFARTCRLIRDRVDDFPFAGFLLKGLLAIAADGGDEIPTVAKQHFEGLQLDEDMLKDVPISFVLPSRGDGWGARGQGEVGVQLGTLISRWSRLSMSN